jgi:3-mercaptopyruvate sulfurtransferase SseA
MSQPRSAVIAGLMWIAAGAAFAQQPQLTPQPPAPEPAQMPAQMQDQMPDQAQPAGDPMAVARRISAADARKAVEKGEAVLVDVRPKESYDAEHAQGALTLPLPEIPVRANELPKDKLVITYCT